MMHQTKDTLYGMDYLASMWNENGVDYHVGFQLLHNLGVRSIRNWMHFGILMQDPMHWKADAVQLMHDILREAEKHGIMVVGMCHQNWSLDDECFTVGKPARNHPRYREWLECYEQCWYMLAGEFPEVAYWEIDNEINNKDFMYVHPNRARIMPLDELAAMSAALLYSGSRGIHCANPYVWTVMGGIVDPIGLGIPETENGVTMVNFLEKLYDDIDSGLYGSTKADDFFQIACWHPYYYTKEPDRYFIEQNRLIYDVIARREGKDKRVFWTELGWSEAHWNTKAIAEAIGQLFPVIRRELPFVECVHYYRFFDNIKEGPQGSYAGLFCDPRFEDIQPQTGEKRMAGAPKETAYAFQKAAGGSGDLTLLIPGTNPQ